MEIEKRKGRQDGSQQRALFESEDSSDKTSLAHQDEQSA